MWQNTSYITKIYNGKHYNTTRGPLPFDLATLRSARHGRRVVPARKNLKREAPPPLISHRSAPLGTDIGLSWFQQYLCTFPAQHWAKNHKISLDMITVCSKMGSRAFTVFQLWLQKMRSTELVRNTIPALYFRYTRTNWFPNYGTIIRKTIGVLFIVWSQYLIFHISTNIRFHTFLHLFSKSLRYLVATCKDSE